MLFRSGRRLVLIACVLSIAVPASAQSLVYVLDPGSNAPNCSGPPCYGPTLHLINAATGHGLASIEAAPAGQRGTSVRASSDGRHLFVTSVPYLSPTQSGVLLVVDAFSKTTIATIPVGAGPTDVAVLPDNSRAYVVNGSADTISVVDLTTFTVTRTIAVQSAPARIVASVNGNAVYVTNSSSGTVSKISTTNDTIAATIVVEAGPLGIDISPDGSRLFVANTTSQTVSVIDANLDSLLRNLPAGTGEKFPVDVSAQSATRVYVGIANRKVPAYRQPPEPGSVDLLDAATGAIQGSVARFLAGQAFARDPSGTPTYAVLPRGIERLSADGTSASLVAGGSAASAAALSDPCGFEATASPGVFGASGGSGALTIPAPAGCAWSLDASQVNGLALSGTTQGIGPATRSFTLAPGNTVQYSSIQIGRQSMVIERTIPVMNIDYPAAGVVTGSFTIVGWAIDQNAGPEGSTGVDAVHVWAYPASGPAQFAGVASQASPVASRSDIAAAYGARYLFAGFQLRIGGLASGSYTIVCFAHSSRSGSFTNAAQVHVVVQQAPTRIVIDAPAPGEVSLTPFRVTGWAVDPNATSGPGVDAVHVYAYPDNGGGPSFLGAAQTAISRPDVGAALGAVFTWSGFDLPLASLTPGGYTLVVYARSTVTGQFFAQTRRVTIQASAPRMFVDAPVTAPPAPIPPGGVDPGTRITSPFGVAGWAVDLSSGAGAGVDAVHVWAYSTNGAAPILLGAATLVSRTDVAAALGARFVDAGFQLTGGTLPSGTYDLVVYARSTVTRTFNNAQVVRITVQ